MDDLVPMRLRLQPPDPVQCSLCRAVIPSELPRFPAGHMFASLDEVIQAEALASARAQETAARKHLEEEHPAVADWLCQKPVRRWG